MTHRLGAKLHSHSRPTCALIRRLSIAASPCRLPAPDAVDIKVDAHAIGGHFAVAVSPAPEVGGAPSRPPMSSHRVYSALAARQLSPAPWAATLTSEGPRGV